MDTNEAAVQRLRLAFDPHAAGEAIMRQNLRRRHLEASEAEIETLLVEWLQTRPGAEAGDAEGVSGSTAPTPGNLRCSPSTTARRTHCIGRPRPATTSGTRFGQRVRSRSSRSLEDRNACRRGPRSHGPDSSATSRHSNDEPYLVAGVTSVGSRPTPGLSDARGAARRPASSEPGSGQTNQVALSVD